MKVIILAGGLGCRLQQESTVKPKRTVKVSGKLAIILTKEAIWKPI